MSRLEVWNLGYSVPTMIHTGTLTFKDADEEQHADSNSTRFVKGLAEFKLQLKSFLQFYYLKPSVQFSLSVLFDSVTPWAAACQAVYHQLPEFTHTHAHQVGDAIQPSHPLLSPSPPAPNSSQHQGLFQWVNSSHQVAKVLEYQLQYQSFQWIFRTDFL